MELDRVSMELDRVSVEWLIIADAAQVVAGKLYLLGGGWEMLTVNTPFPVEQPLAIAVACRVPWNETNRRHDVDVVIENEDGTVLQQVNWQFEVGRPVGTHPGQVQRAQFTVNGAFKLPAPGTYVVLARIDGQEGARARFNVVQGLPAAMPPPR